MVAREWCLDLRQKILRKKVIAEDEMHKTELKRCLSTVHLIGLGAGSTLGAGIYVLSGQVAKDTAGPAVVISFIVAGLTAALAGVCYGEFAARVPRAGSAYVYSYVTVGELMAFVIGWNILLEYVIGVSSVASALSSYLDYLLDHKMYNFFNETMPMNVPAIAPFPDFFACFLVIVATCIVGVGIHESTVVNNIMTIINVVVIVGIDIAGFTQASLHNWQLPVAEIAVNVTDHGSGGFAPFGFSGIMSGAAMCFFAYVGFDYIASLGEEAEDPRHGIPVSMMITLLLNLVLYSATAAMVTLVCPYYLVDVNAPLTFVFDYIGWPFVKYIVTVGAVCGMASSMMGSMLPLARVTYAMASDGLLFRCLANVNPRLQTPLLGTIVTGVFTALTALLLDLTSLVHMLSIGTLQAFTLVSVSVLILRYQCEEHPTDSVCGTMDEASSSACVGGSIFSRLRACTPCSPTPRTSRTANICIACDCSLITVCGLFIALRDNDVMHNDVVMPIIGSLIAVAMVFFVVLLFQPRNDPDLNFKVPLVPFIPMLSCMINIYLMFKLSAITWIRFCGWIIIGFLIYIFYGLRHSSLNSGLGEKTPLCVSFDKSASSTPVLTYGEKHTQSADVPKQSGAAAPKHSLSLSREEPTGEAAVKQNEESIDSSAW